MGILKEKQYLETHVVIVYLSSALKFIETLSTFSLLGSSINDSSNLSFMNTSHNLIFFFFKLPLICMV